MSALREVPVLFLDIDGTVRWGPDELGGRFVNSATDVVVFPQAVEMMRRWRGDMGGRIVGVSNQGGVGLGYVSHEAAEAAMARTRDLAEGLIDLIVMCTHSPGYGCSCRKPHTGMLAQAVAELTNLHPDECYPMHQALMIGDRDEDRLCALTAGAAFMWAQPWRDLAEVPV